MAEQEEKKKEVTDNDTSKLLDLVETSFRSGDTLDSIPDGICGRIQKFITHKEKPKQLSRPYKLFSWIFGGDGLYELSLLQSNVSKLKYIGITNDYIKNSMVSNNINFRLMLFSANNNDAYAATWQNVLMLLEKYVNKAYIRMEKHIDALKKTPFEEIQKKGGFSFLEIHLLGEDKSEKFMSLARFNSIAVDKVTLVDCRLFLYNWLGLKELYTGDGYTKKDNGNDANKADKGCLEYLMPNKFLKDIPDLRIVELPIDLSELK